MNYSLIGSVESNSLLLFAAGIFMFFAMPLMNPPFIFVSYGGPAVVSLACGVLVFHSIVRGQSCRCVSWHNPAKPLLDGAGRASASASNPKKV